MTVKTTGHGGCSGFLQDQTSRLLNLFLHWITDWELTYRMETKLSFVSDERKIGNLHSDSDLISPRLKNFALCLLWEWANIFNWNINEYKYKRTSNLVIWEQINNFTKTIYVLLSERKVGLTRQWGDIIASYRILPSLWCQCIQDCAKPNLLAWEQE
jgi:hypothetical protein